MKNIIFLCLSSLFLVTLFSCNKDTETPIVPIRDYAVQYATDKDSIEIYLKNNYLTTTTTNGYPDVEIAKIPTGGTQTSVWNNITYPLQSVTVTNDARASYYVDGKSTDVVQYKMYYMVINQGAGQTPVSTDSTYTSYKGWTLNNKVFDSNNVPIWSTYPQLSISETTLISGYRQILSKIKTAAAVNTGTDGAISYSNMGSIVVFVPSALGYYNLARTGINAYSCTVFRIRLHTLRKRDHDGDTVASFNEDVNNDGDFFNDDTDGDNIPNFLDLDDDGDSFLTKNELRNQKRIADPFNPAAKILKLFGYFPFDGAATDNPATLDIDERQGIPQKFTGAPYTISIDGKSTTFNAFQQTDFTDVARVRRHLDKTAFPPFE